MVIYSFSGVDSIYPCDFVPFTRKPLFIVVDSDNSKAFKAGFLPLTFSSFVVAILVVVPSPSLTRSLQTV